MDVVRDPVRALLRRPPVLVGFDASVRDVAAILSEESIGAALVRRTTSHDATAESLEGLVSERDISRAVAGDLDLDAAHASDVMTLDVTFAAADTTILRVAARMLAHGIRHLPVRDGDRLLGVVSERDVLGALLQQVQDQLHNDG